ncbi:MAG: hypothetical protein KA968_03000 [Chitinophagaceae bacterium]|nr:hypothetical protein [Chitinophagaceae bacterium]MBP7106981.1 hypothetical protein [Chitinophagaceae bacterium]MBP7314158.1 hypothetical protein [Chitinophagaceae bacterium]HQX95477.1 hypothetical protein [Chitinophagaceae bacterium]HQZ49105.1 hypothetical protein [Chitinophagaceae bacterium]
MKKKILIIGSFFIAFSAIAIKVVDGIIERLGLEHKFAQGNIVSNLVGSFSSGPMETYEDAGGFAGDQPSSFKLPYVPKLKLSTILSGDKSAAATELCEYVKKYINSEEFMTQYYAQRENAMPLTANGTSLSTLKGNKIVHQKNINNYKTDTKYVAEQQKELDETQKKIDALVEAAKKPFPGKANWEKRYPLDPSGLVKKRLQEYLQLAATVDFNAVLAAPDKYNVKKFVNLAFEKKPHKWKAIYRAGKEVNDVVTAFVKEWLKGEIISSTKTKMAENTSSVPASNVATNPTTNESVKATNSKAQESVTATKTNSSTTDSTKTKKSLLNKVKGKIGF